MVRVEGQSATREELERRFVDQHASFARGWALSRDQRLTSWVSPGGTAKIQATLIPFEYKQHPSDVAGLIGEALEWSGEVLRRQDDGRWVPTLVRVKPKKKKKKLRRSA